MIKASITGGIGSGKTIICKVFRHMGVPVYHSDERAKAILDSNPEVIKKVKQAFGEELYKGPQLDRKKMAALVFSDKTKLGQLNAIAHPAVALDFNNWLVKHQHHPYVLKEAAILIEAGLYEQVDYVILVTAPEELRIKRVEERDKMNKEEIKKRMALQWTDEEKSKFADAVIINDEKHLVIPQVLTVHNQLMEASKETT